MLDPGERDCQTRLNSNLRPAAGTSCPAKIGHDVAIDDASAARHPNAVLPVARLEGGTLTSW